MKRRLKTEVLSNGARGDRGHLTKLKAGPFKRAIVRFSGTCSCGDINDLKFVFRFFENL